jgi:hypothetical protein
VNLGVRFTALVSNVLPGWFMAVTSAKGVDLGDLSGYRPQACPNVGTRMPSPVGADRKLRSW